MPKLRCTILGCGTSAGVPSLGFGWSLCDPKNPKNNRMRCSMLIQWEEIVSPSIRRATPDTTSNENRLLRNLLIDSSPDCRTQLLQAQIKHLDAILYTHEHADHCHGIDDLKWMRDKSPIPAYGSHITITNLVRRFGYIFSSNHSFPLHQTILEPHEIIPFKSFYPLDSNKVLTPIIIPIALDHGFNTQVLGFRIGDFAYTTDFINISKQAYTALKGIRWWVVGCLRREQHPTHAHLELVISWVEQLGGVHMTYLTHMNGTMDYNELCTELPVHIRPAHDFLQFEAEF